MPQERIPKVDSFAFEVEVRNTRDLVAEIDMFMTNYDIRLGRGVYKITIETKKGE